MRVYTSFWKKGFIVEDSGNILLEAFNKNWFSLSVLTDISGNLMEFTPKGVFSSSYLIYRNGEQAGLAEFKWRGPIHFHFLDQWGLERYFILKPHGFFNPHYEITDENENSIFGVKSFWDWKSFSQGYDITVLRQNFHGDTLLELIFLSVCAIKVVNQRKSSASAAS